VGHGDVQLLGRDRAGERRVDVADHDHEVRPLGQADLLEGDHDPGRLLGVGPGAGAEEVVRRGQAEVPEKGLGHPCVVVLAGVHEPAVQPREPGGLAEAGDLHEIGPCTGHHERLHGMCNASKTCDVSTCRNSGESEVTPCAAAG